MKFMSAIYRWKLTEATDKAKLGTTYKLAWKSLDLLYIGVTLWLLLYTRQ